MGKTREGGRGRASLLLTKSRLVSISHPHHPSPLDRVGREEGKGDRLDFGSVPGPSLLGPFPGVKTPGGNQGFCLFEPMGKGGVGWGHQGAPIPAKTF